MSENTQTLLFWIGFFVVIGALVVFKILLGKANKKLLTRLTSTFTAQGWRVLSKEEYLTPFATNAFLQRLTHKVFNVQLALQKGSKHDEVRVGVGKYFFVAGNGGGELEAIQVILISGSIAKASPGWGFFSLGSGQLPHPKLQSNEHRRKAGTLQFSVSSPELLDATPYATLWEWYQTDAAIIRRNFFTRASLMIQGDRCDVFVPCNTYNEDQIHAALDLFATVKSVVERA